MAKEDAPRLRSDAQRNREMVLAAARAVFAEQGLDASLDEIAHRAGVGNATLYRRFPTRESLWDAVFGDTVEEFRRIGEQSLRADDPWTGFRDYLHRLFERLATDRGLGDLITLSLPETSVLDGLKRRNHRVMATLVRRAKAAGTVRADLTVTDVVLALRAASSVVAATAAVRPGAWRRPCALLVDSFRAEGAHPLPTPALTAAELTEVMRRYRRQRARSRGARS